MYFSKLKKIFLKRKYLLDIIIILVLGLLSLTWFRGNYLINGGDFGMPFDWVKYFKRMFSVWVEGNSLGSLDPRNIASLFPYATFGALMQSLGFSLVLIEKIFFYFWFVGGGLSMYFLCSVCEMKRLGKMMAALFYMLNPFSLIIIWHISHALIQMPYSFAPLYLGLYIYGLKKKKGLGYIFAFVLVWILTTVPAYAWPAALVIHLIPIFFYFVFSLIYFPAERGFILKFTLKLVLVFLGLNFYWLSPFLYSITESMAGAQSHVLLNDIDTLKLTSNKIFEAIRMLGYWALPAGYKSDPYYSYEAFYRSSLVKVLSWLIPLMVFLGFLNKESRKKPFLVFFLVLIILGITGIAGPYSPFGGILISLYKTFPFLALLTRFTFLFWGIPTYIVFTVLLGYGFLFIYEQGKRFLGKLVLLPISAIAFILFVILVKPFWTGEIIRSKGKVSPGERIKIPSYWWEAKKWFSEQKGFYRILPLPMSQTYNMIYNWEEGYSGGDPIRWISDNPVIFFNTGESFKIPELIGKIIEEERDFKEAGKLLGMINVKYVLYRKDIVWNYIIGHNSWFAHNPQKIERFLKNQKDLTLVKTFGPWEVYEVAAGDIFPRIYIPEKNILAIGGSDVLEYFSSELVSEEKNAIFFLEGKIDQDKVKKFSPSQVIIEEKPEFLAETEDNNKNNLRDFSLKEVNDLLAAVRYYPGSILYNAIRIKESLQKFMTPFPQKIQFELLFMEKRLKESHFLIVKGKTEKASRSLGEIISRWEKVKNDSNKVIVKKDKDELLLMIDKELSLQKIFVDALKREIPEKIEDQKIKKTIGDLSDVVDQKRIYFFGVKPSSANSAKDEQEVIYNLNIPISAVYDLYLPIDTFESWPIREGNNIQFKLDNGKIVNKSLELDGEWERLFSLGEFPLAEGKHFIKILLPPGDYLIADPSFENGTWEGIPEITQYSYFKERPFKEQNQEATEGKYSLKLFSSLNNVAVFNRIIDFNPKYTYRVFVSTKNLSNDSQELVFWEDEADNSIPILDTFRTDPFGSSEQLTRIQTIKFPNSSQWQRYMFTFSPKNSSAKSGGLAFVSGRTLFGETINLYDDIKVERVFDSPLLLRAVLSDSDINEPSPKIEFKKINSAKYEINVKAALQPYFLIFSEAFHKDWNLSINEEHLKINDFANGWYIDKLGDYKITLFFKPQKVYYVSISITISSSVILVLYFIRRKLGSKSES